MLKAFASLGLVAVLALAPIGAPAQDGFDGARRVFQDSPPRS